jgi:phage terminase Nu1 subunit (DNA packaging protein)
MDSNTEISSAALQRLLGIGKSVLSELAQRGIVVKGRKRGTFELEASVSAYCAHLQHGERPRGRGRGGGQGAARTGAGHLGRGEGEAACW